jgi:hypothetical protein
MKNPNSTRPTQYPSFFIIIIIIIIYIF